MAAPPSGPIYHQIYPNPDPPPNGPALSTLRGIVKLQGVNRVTRPISIHIGGHKTITTDGHFAIPNLEVGKHEIQITAEHYQSYIGNVAVTPESTTMEVTLQTRYSEDELDLFARLVYAEAAGEPIEGQIAMAASVLNRVTSPKYPNTLEGVIMEKVSVDGVEYYQYSPVLDGRIWELNPVSQRETYNACLEVIYAALGGQDPSEGSTGFYNPDKVRPDAWVRTQQPTVKIGNHQFFL